VAAAIDVLRSSPERSTPPPAEPDFGKIERTLRRLYEAAASTAAQLTTFTLGRAYMVPVFADWRERVAAVNAITRSLAGEYGAVVIDMWDHPVNERANLLSADRIHFSTSGQAVMAAEVIRALAKVLRHSPFREETGR
jgi:lysophospholipase L1-like esterase